MAWWKRRTKGHARAGRPGRSDGPEMDIDHAAVRSHAEQFVKSRRGVEAYVEPATNISTTTMVLIAHDGEWTRRAVGSAKAGFELGRLLQIPVYDVNQTGYPARMREWNHRHKS